METLRCGTSLMSLPRGQSEKKQTRPAVKGWPPETNVHLGTQSIWTTLIFLQEVFGKTRTDMTVPAYKAYFGVIIKMINMVYIDKII